VAPETCDVIGFEQPRRLVDVLSREIKFGKLVDGTGRVFTNAVVIVEDDRVKSVATGNASIPSGAEVIDHNQYYVENADSVYRYPPGTKERLLAYIQRNFEKVFRAGVHIVVGSDAVYNGWGLNMRELDWLVKLGMTPEQALKAATTEPAAMLGMEKSLGAVAPGFYADIVAVEGDPLANISVV
jgi:imidazolonepropionase-like amidohydrolase